MDKEKEAKEKEEQKEKKGKIFGDPLVEIEA